MAAEMGDPWTVFWSISGQRLLCQATGSYSTGSPAFLALCQHDVIHRVVFTFLDGGVRLPAHQARAAHAVWTAWLLSC